ncbi:hypothetical protein ACFQ12_00025, partial [Methylobacterium trifolii]
SLGPALAPLEPPDPRFAALSGGPKHAIYWDRLCDLAPGRRIALVWEGNRYNDQFLLQGDPLFDLLVAEQPDAPLIPGAVLVPERAVRERFSETAARFSDFLERLTQRMPRRIGLVGGPPPKANGARLSALLRVGAYDEKLAVVHGLNPVRLTVTPASIRLKLWQVEQTVLKAVSDRHGCLYVGAPAETADAEGCLRAEFWAEDATHANIGYGLLMREAIARAFAEADA